MKLNKRSACVGSFPGDERLVLLCILTEKRKYGARGLGVIEDAQQWLNRSCVVGQPFLSQLPWRCDILLSVHQRDDENAVRNVHFSSNSLAAVIVAAPFGIKSALRDV